MELDYSNYRMTDWKWVEEYKERIGKEAFDKFLNMVYTWLLELKPGQSLDISSHSKITDRNRELFIKIGCLFISEGNSSYEFSNDFTKITNNGNISGIRKTEKSKDLEEQGKGVSV